MPGSQTANSHLSMIRPERFTKVSNLEQFSKRAPDSDWLDRKGSTGGSGVPIEISSGSTRFKRKHGAGAASPSSQVRSSLFRYEHDEEAIFTVFYVACNEIVAGSCSAIETRFLAASATDCFDFPMNVTELAQEEIGFVKS